MTIFTLRDFTLRAAQNQPADLGIPSAGATVRATELLPLLEVFEGTKRVGFVASQPTPSQLGVALNFHRAPENQNFNGGERVLTGLIRRLAV